MMFEEYYRRTWEDTDGDISEHQTAHATALRIPILSTSYPRWYFITGIVVGTAWFDEAEVPTDDEVSQVAELLKSYNTYYRQSFLDAMKHFAPYDIDGGANGMYFRKLGEGDWVYRKRTWNAGWSPTRYPAGADLPSDDPQSLDVVIGRAFQGWGRRSA